MVSTVPIKHTNRKNIVSDSKELISLIREMDPQTQSRNGGLLYTDTDAHRNTLERLRLREGFP